MKRTPENCEYRVAAKGSGEQMTCRLLSRLSELEDDWTAVNDDICNACCDSFLPSTDDWNPVVASLMHAIGDRVIQAGGVAGCTIDRAKSICESAISQLPIVLPDEDDCVDDIQHFKKPQNVSRQQIGELLPLPPVQTSSGVRWAVGVTTSPRRQSTLAPSLESLIASGWQDPHLFVDGDVNVNPKLDHLARTMHSNPTGAWPAWRRAAQGLLNDHPDANAIMIVQDDAMFPHLENLRAYIDSLLWPSDPETRHPSILSLYTSTDDTISESRWRVLPRRWVYGAVAMVFQPDQIRSILRADDQGLLDVVKGHAGVDTRIGYWAEQSGIDVWHPSPSLVQHIGQVSTVWSHSRAVGLRRASRFIADEF